MYLHSLTGELINAKNKLQAFKYFYRDGKKGKLYKTFWWHIKTLVL